MINLTYGWAAIIAYLLLVLGTAIGLGVAAMCTVSKDADRRAGYGTDQ